MLRKKLKLSEFSKNKIQHNLVPETEPNGNCSTSTSNDIKTETESESSQYFNEPLWKQFYKIECDLNIELEKLEFASLIIYNPIIYASEIHKNYLIKYLNGPKKLILIGMNPGPNGMAQTGVPFGSINIVRNCLKIEGKVDQPPIVHPKRKITGLSCTTEEPSGNKFWNLIIKLAGNIENFSEQCFMHNFCPLVFYDKLGKNITPSELKGANKKLVRDICLKYLAKQLQILKPEIVIAVGSYVDDCLKSLKKEFSSTDTKYFKLVHPSPRSLNNQNWPEKGEKFFEENDLIKYLKNEI